MKSQRNKMRHPERPLYDSTAFLSQQIVANLPHRSSNKTRSATKLNCMTIALHQSPKRPTWPRLLCISTTLLRDTVLPRLHYLCCPLAVVPEMRAGRCVSVWQSYEYIPAESRGTPTRRRCRDNMACSIRAETTTIKSMVVQK